MALSEKTIDTLLDVLNNEIESEYSYLVNGMGGEDKTYIKNLIEAKKELLELNVKTTFDKIILNELIEADLKILEELK